MLRWWRVKGEKRDIKRRWSTERERGVWKSAEENVGDNLSTYLSPAISTADNELSLLPARPSMLHFSFERPRSFRPPVSFVFHLGAYRTKSLCILLTTGRMHSECKWMCDNVQVNVSRERTNALLRRMQL